MTHCRQVPEEEEVGWDSGESSTVQTPPSHLPGMETVLCTCDGELLSEIAYLITTIIIINCICIL